MGLPTPEGRMGPGDRGPTPASSMCDSGRLSKLLLALLGPLLTGSAVVPILGGFFFLLTNRCYRHFIGNDYLLLPAGLSFAVGGLLILTGIIGLCITVNRSHCQQGTFQYLVLILFCLEVTTGTLGYINSVRVESADLDAFNEIFRNYNGNDSTIESGTVDRLQRQMQCCGVTNYTDWTQFPWFIQSGNASVPHSCCARNLSTCTGDMEEPELLYTEGCLLTLRDQLWWIFLFTLGWVIAACCLQSLGALIICLLMNSDPAPYELLNNVNFS
ncbi:tetraspanin-3-like isoform X1 [Heterodontus francisci]|uniref:tetraspanin-3-like isoform X1 n=1 Tax=Heterodontus francisci TaxID=7792 RepID=UPI00355BE572